MSTFWRYLRIQAFILLCGIVGPLFLAIYFMTGADPTLKWMFWAGLGVTATDVLIALALTSFGTRSAAKKAALERDGVVALARVTHIGRTNTHINNQPLVKLDLQISGPGIATFTSRDRVLASPDRMPMLNRGQLVALVDPTTREYQIDWQRSALIGGPVPATVTLDSDGSTHDLSGQVEPLLEILRILKAHGIAPDGPIDLRDQPAARQQVQAVIRRSVAGAAQATPAPTPAASAPSIGQRLQELESLRADGMITESEYQDKRRQIIDEL